MENEKEIENIEIEVIRNFNRNHVIKHVPVYTLSEILSLKKIYKLKKICKLLSIKGYSKMEKQKIIENIVSKMMKNFEFFKDVLYTLDDNEWNVFKSAVCKKHLINNKVPYTFFIKIQSMGFLEVFYDEDNQYIVIPEEVKSLYEKINDEDFKHEKELLNNLNKYARAATAIYGYINKDDFIEIFNRQNGYEINAQYLEKNLSKFIVIDSGYLFWENYIVNSVLEGYESTYVEFQNREIINKPKFHATNEQYLNYSKFNYYEDESEVKKIKDFLFENLKLENSIINLIISKMYYLTVMGATIIEIVNIFDGYFINLSSKKFNEIVNLVSDMMNTTRLWINNGYTNLELNDLNKKPRLSLLKGSLDEDVNRDPLCICGSGKKYIDCCFKHRNKILN